MTTLDAGPAGGAGTGPGFFHLPCKLKLEFSKAADYDRVNRLFDPALKSRTDPKSYVVKRLDSAFRDAIDQGAAALLSDENDEIQTITIAYRAHESDAPAPQQPHDFTEIGSSMARMAGYNSARLIVAAIALSEWWRSPPAEVMVAEIKNDNKPSLTAYRDVLGWEKLDDCQQIIRINSATDKTLADENDKGQGPVCSMYGTSAASWYMCTAQTLATQARVLLEFMNQGGLLNKNTGDYVPVDFSALHQAGLSRPRLEEIAKGQVARDLLLKI